MRRRSKYLGWFALASAFLALVGPGAAVAQADENETPTTRQQQAKQPSLDPLLDRFPIGTGRVRTADPSAQGVSEQESASEGTSGMVLVLLAVWAGGIALLVTFGVRALYRWRKRRSGRVSTLASASARSKPKSKQATERSPRVTEPAKERDVRQPVTPTPAAHDRPDASRGEAGGPDGSHEGSYDEVGRGVAGILEAAEVAADRIRAEAVDAATGIRKAAEDEATARRASAEQEAAKVLRDAETSANEAQSAVERELSSRRAETEEQARSILSDAESQALVVREAAAEKARQIEEASRERDEELRAQVQPLEENVRRALETFGAISAELEQLLADLAVGADASLVDDLNESTKRAEARIDGAARS